MKKTVIITGGTTGIGKATAFHFAKNGSNVVVTSRNANKETEIISEFKQNGFEVTFFPLDVTNEEQVASVILKTVEKFGKLDSIVNNSGISLGAAELADTKCDDLKQMLDTNVMGVYYGMKYAITAMLKTGGGTIVNLASIAGINGLYATAQYNASKHAVVGLTKSSALDYAAQGIRINAVSPGLIHTPMADKMIEGGQKEALDEMLKTVPVGRLGRPEEIGNAVVWLCSDAASLMVGHNLVIDGGYSIQ